MNPEKKHFTSIYFMYVAIAFVTVLLISNTVAVKLITLFGFTFTGAIALFPFAYIFGDILTEVYGYSASRKIIWSGFIALIFMSLMYYVVQILPAAGYWPNQGAYESILGIVPRVVVASIIGYFAGEFANSFTLSKLKIFTNGKYLWTRTVGSTVVGQAVDTIFFVVILFYGELPAEAIFTIVVSSYIFKVLVEIVFTPFTYVIIKKLKKLEGQDVFDNGVNYNPFRL
jgi:uncharacterized integral membrane protein (TIGR00697 family)